MFFVFTAKRFQQLAGGQRSATTGYHDEHRFDPERGGSPLAIQENPMSTYASLHYHIVFSTKNRERWIDRSWETRLQYLV